MLNDSLLIINEVCKVLELDVNLLLSNSQLRIYKDAQHIAVYIIRNNVKVFSPVKCEPNRFKQITYKEIAVIFNKKQHWTIMSSELECKNLLKVDKGFKIKFDKVMANCELER